VREEVHRALDLDWQLGGGVLPVFVRALGGGVRCLRRYRYPIHLVGNRVITATQQCIIRIAICRIFAKSPHFAATLINRSNSWPIFGRMRAWRLLLPRLSSQYQAALKSFLPSASSAANSSSDSVMPTAATFSSRCLTFEVPGIGSITGLRFSTQARAI